MITAKQIDILRHTVGATSAKIGYRNRYVTEMDNKDVQGLIDLGLMSGPYFTGEFGENMGMFTATETAFVLMNVKKIQALERSSQELQRQRDDYREFWLSKNAMHSWERTERIGLDAADLARVVGVE